MRSVSLVSSAALFAVLAFFADGCRGRDSSDITKPVDTVASTKPSASAKPIVVEVTAARCIDGSLVKPIDSTADAGPSVSDAGASTSGGIGLGTLTDGGDVFGAGGLGFFGGLGGGEGIGLATTGGGFGKPRAVQLRGQTLRVEGMPTETAEQVICNGFAELETCVDKAGSYDKDLDGTIGLQLTLTGADGHATVKIVGGTLDGETLQACIVQAGTELTFHPEAGKAATVVYALSAHRRRKVKTVKMKEAGMAITGRLPPEVVKRIVRANFPRFRACYEAELKKDPKLEGTISTSFVINEKGEPEAVKAGGGTMGNATVQACVTKVFTTLSYPEPEGGKVAVTYPIEFKNAD